MRSKQNVKRRENAKSQSLIHQVNVSDSTPPFFFNHRFSQMDTDLEKNDKRYKTKILRAKRLKKTLILTQSRREKKEQKKKILCAFVSLREINL